MDAKSYLFVGLGAMLVVYSAAVVRGGVMTPTIFQTAIGFVTAFFDTLGIGSFATTTSVYIVFVVVYTSLNMLSTSRQPERSSAAVGEVA